MTFTTMRLKRVLSHNDGGVWGDDPTGLADSVVLRSTHQSAEGEWLDVQPAVRSLSPVERVKARLLTGDLLLTKSSGSALHIGKTTLVTGAIAESRPAYSNFMQRLRVAPDNVPRFYWYCVRSEFVRDQLSLISTTTTGLANLNDSTINELEVPVPSPVQQRQIADYLDAQTAKIDALIGKQERLIETLAERRQAVISHAVIKGLDPNAAIRYSGVPWLGTVPSHWTVTAVKRLLSVPITDGPHETPEFLDEGVPFVSAEAVSSGAIRFDKIRGHISADEHARFSRKYVPKRDDIFVVKSGATTGVAAIVDTDKVFNIWSPLAALRVRAGVVPRFLLNFIRSREFQTAVELNWSYGTQQNIGMGTLGQLFVALPPEREQQAITEHLDRETSQIDALSAKAREMIDVLKERRQALISAAVTGKIDVRGLA